MSTAQLKQIQLRLPKHVKDKMLTQTGKNKHFTSGNDLALYVLQEYISMYEMGELEERERVPYSRAAIRLPEEMKDMLNRIANSEGKSLNQVVVDAFDKVSIEWE